MAACPYGSEVQPGKPAYVWLDPAYLWVSLSGTAAAFLAPIVYAIQSVQLSTATLCAVDQPDPGAFPSSDLILWLATGTMGAPQSWQRLYDWLVTWGRAFLWSQNCQCKAAPGSICFRTVRSSTITVTLDDWDGPAFSVPMGTARIRLRITAASGSDLAHTQFNITTLSGGVQVATNGGLAASTATPGPYTTAAWSIPYDGIRIYWQKGPGWSGGSPGSYSATVQVEREDDPCGGTTVPAPTAPARPTGVVDAPTTPIAALADLGPAIDRINAELLELKGEVRYLVGQSTPYAYSLGTPSSGLSGTGYVSVAECLGVLVTLTTIPSTKGAQAGTPPRHFDVGRINWGDVNGYHAHHPIHESPELILGIPDTATRIGYTFPAGVVATITPVKRA